MAQHWFLPTILMSSLALQATARPGAVLAANDPGRPPQLVNNNTRILLAPPEALVHSGSLTASAAPQPEPASEAATEKAAAYDPPPGEHRNARTGRREAVKKRYIEDMDPPILIGFGVALAGSCLCSCMILACVGRSWNPQVARDNHGVEYARLLRECPDIDRQHFLSSGFRAKCDGLFNRAYARAAPQGPRDYRLDQTEPLPEEDLETLTCNEAVGAIRSGGWGNMQEYMKKLNETEGDSLIQAFTKGSMVNRRSFETIMRYLEMMERQHTWQKTPTYGIQGPRPAVSRPRSGAGGGMEAP